MGNMIGGIVTAVLIALFFGAFAYVIVLVTEQDRVNRVERTKGIITKMVDDYNEKTNKRAVSRGFAHYDRDTAEIVWDNEDVRFVVYGGNVEVTKGE